MATLRILFILSVLALALTSCKPTATTPEPTAAPVPTTPPVVSPVATAPQPKPTVISPLAPAPAVVVRQEGTPMAIINLHKLLPDHKYRLLVTSSAGAVPFAGTWSESAVGADGLPGAKTGLLEGTTPATFDIVPPVTKVAKDWVYSAQVSNKKGGSITLTLVDVGP